MTRLERYKERLSMLENRRNRLARSGRLVESHALHQDIEEARRLVREAEEYEEAMRPRAIKDLVSREELDRMNIIPLMIECHLAADFVAEIAYMVVDACKESGFSAVTLAPELTEMLGCAERFASFLTTLSPELCDLLVRNETFNASLHRKFVNYIEQRLK